jgi:lipopolysaccharide/colanic/teichoic acid biosynthesis glycosyltransferase
MKKYFSKRFFDIFFALFFLFFLSPLFLVIALLVRSNSPGKAFFFQERVGKAGRIFVIYKFRTMGTGAGGPVLTEKNDPRVTSVGKILRRTSLDELPQLLNILKGEMSFIGPRPEVPSIVATYSEEQRGVLEVLPGLTGWSQIHGRDDLDIPTKLGYDLEYARRVSFLLDLEILLRTPSLLISGRGIK